MLRAPAHRNSRNVTARDATEVKSATLSHTHVEFGSRVSYDCHSMDERTTCMARRRPTAPWFATERSHMDDKPGVRHVRRKDDRWLGNHSKNELFARGG